MTAAPRDGATFPPPTFDAGSLPVGDRDAGGENLGGFFGTAGNRGSGGSVGFDAGPGIGGQLEPSGGAYGSGGSIGTGGGLVGSGGGLVGSGGGLVGSGGGGSSEEASCRHNVDVCLAQYDDCAALGQDGCLHIIDVCAALAHDCDDTSSQLN